MAEDDIAAVLKLIHDSVGRWRTLRAEGDQWSDPERARDAFMRNVPPGGVVSSRGTPGQADLDPTWKLWMAPPRFRADFGGPHQSRTLIIGDGRRLCFSHPATDFLRVTDQREDQPHVGPASELLWTYSLPSVLHLDVDGRRRFLDREVLVVRGRPRPEAQRRGPRLFMGADEVEFGLDAERGVLLWIEERLDGGPYRRVTMTSVAFDEDLDSALFEFSDRPEVQEASLPVRGEPRRLAAPHPPQGPPDGVLGEPVAGRAIVARTDTIVIAADRIVAYPTGFELGITVRTNDRPVHGSFDDHRQRAWSGMAAFPGESVRVSVVFADGRRGRVDTFVGAGGRHPPCSGARSRVPKPVRPALRSNRSRHPAWWALSSRGSAGAWPRPGPTSTPTPSSRQRRKRNAVAVTGEVS